MNILKTVLIFVALKILEISGIAVIIFGCKKFAELIWCVMGRDLSSITFIDYFFLGGVFPFLGMLAIATVLSVIYILILSNWQSAKELAEKF